MKSKKIEFLGYENNKLTGTLFGHLTNKKCQIVLFMHGGGQTRHAWNRTAYKLSQKGYVTITIDARGHGDSQWSDSENYSLDAFAKDLLSICFYLELNSGLPPIVVGASLGGLSAMLALHHHPNFCYGLILVDIVPSPEKQGVAEIEKFMRASMKTGFETIEEAAQAIAKYTPNKPQPKSNAGLIKNLRKENNRYHWHWDPALWTGKNPINKNEKKYQKLMWKACKNIDSPCLLIRGSKSKLVTEKKLVEFIKIVPQCQLIDIIGAQHIITGNTNNEFTNAIIKFIQAQAKPG